MPLQWTWPAITEGPTSPGTGEPVYQPAVMAAVGTSRVPSFVRPSLTRVEFTPIAGMLMRVGASGVVAVDAAVADPT
jgi:hypothetical protein